MVYVIKSGEHIKIGMSANMHSRFRNLQSSNPNELKIKRLYKTTETDIDSEADNDRRLERYLHQHFHNYRITANTIETEWFESKILNDINDAVTAFSKKHHVPIVRFDSHRTMDEILQNKEITPRTTLPKYHLCKNKVSFNKPSSVHKEKIIQASNKILERG